eukprot:6191288-Pleurochrysis_carterae.AAC.2
MHGDFYEICYRVYCMFSGRSSGARSGQIGKYGRLMAPKYFVLGSMLSTRTYGSILRCTLGMICAPRHAQRSTSTLRRTAHTSDSPGRAAPRRRAAAAAAVAATALLASP